jgi:SagB-type dehydrogenase family enzyme
MQRRRSIRSYGRQPIRAEDLGALLRLVARNQSVQPPNPAQASSYETLLRPYPGAGGLHELHIYPVVSRCDGLPRGIYCYDGSSDRLLSVARMNEPGEQLLRDAAHSMGVAREPDVLLCIAARFGRVNWKYEGIAYSLILKDVGVLLEALYLAATALQLAPCALGRGDTRLFLRATGNRPFEEESVGEFAVGSRPDISGTAAS